MGDQVSERDGAVAQLERGRQIPVGAFVDAHNAVGHRFRQNEPGENFCYRTEPEVGIAIGRLFAADHLRAEAEDLRSGFCDKACDEARRLIESPSGDAERRPASSPQRRLTGLTSIVLFSQQPREISVFWQSSSMTVKRSLTAS